MRMNFEVMLEEQIRKVLSGFNEPDIYVISFLLEAEKSSVYKGISKFPAFSIGYNTEADCRGAGPLDNERWDYRLWPRKRISLIDAEHPDMADALLEWYDDLGITDVRDEAMKRGFSTPLPLSQTSPCYYMQLINLISYIAHKLYREGFIEKLFGKIAFMVHENVYTCFTAMLTPDNMLYYYAQTALFEFLDRHPNRFSSFSHNNPYLDIGLIDKPKK